MEASKQRRKSMFDPESHVEEEGTDPGSFQFMKALTSTSEDGLDRVLGRGKPDTENTFRLEPTIEVRRDKIFSVIKSVLDPLENTKYIEHFAPRLAMDISVSIRKELKALKYHQYRYVIIVSIGERGNQDVAMMCKFLWTPQFDHYAYYSMENYTLFINAIAFAVYKF